ncbi:futalosine hydrolase [Streptomyces sp. NPDC058417]|uniref:futalosine hydrolase n=1 Tax=unclassified Streptomyces TaxID=2593676 RepID=UPI00366A231A
MVVQAQEGRLTTSGAPAAPGARVLIATAVAAERDAVARAFPALPARVAHRPGVTLHRLGDRLDLLAAGVGPAAAAAAVSAALTSAALDGDGEGDGDGGRYGLVVSAGIGGGFAPGAPVGSLVVADVITAADLGADSPDGFLPVTELGFGRVSHHPPRSLVRRTADATGAATGTVLTVSTVTGTAARADALRARHPHALAEAMEGFGVAEAADAHGAAVLEIRAVSNPVGPRDRAAWRIGDALAALTAAFGKLAPVLESWNRHDQ